MEESAQQNNQSHRFNRITQYTILVNQSRLITALVSNCNITHTMSVDKKSNLICKNCRKFEIDSSCIIESHGEVGRGESDFSHRKRGGNPMSDSKIIYNGHNECTLIFLEPQEWMQTEKQGEVEGKINCQNCQFRLGTWSWRGTQCSCGKWVTPAFYVHSSKVDKRTNVIKHMSTPSHVYIRDNSASPTVSPVNSPKSQVQDTISTPPAANVEH